MGWNTRAPELTQACTACYDDMYLDGSICTADEGVGSDNFEEKPTFRKSWEHCAIWRNPRTKWRFGKKNIDSIGVSRLAMVDFRWVKLDAVFGCHFCWTSAGVCFRWTFTTSCENRVFIRCSSSLKSLNVTQCHYICPQLLVFKWHQWHQLPPFFAHQPTRFCWKPTKNAGELGGSGTAFRHGTALRWNSEAQESALRGSIRTQKAAGWDLGGHGPTVICLLHGISFGISWDFTHGYPYGWSYTHCCDLSLNMYT